MPQELSEQASTTEYATSEREEVSQLILAHRAAIDAWYRERLLAHRLYVSRLLASKQASEQATPT